MTVRMQQQKKASEQRKKTKTIFPIVFFSKTVGAWTKKQDSLFSIAADAENIW